MGTSGAYGGSDSKAWNKARQLLLDLPSGLGGPGQDGKAPPNDLDNVEPLWIAIADALAGEDPSLKGPKLDDNVISLDRLIPPLKSTSHSGGGGSGGAVPGRATPTGRSGSGSRRQVVRNAARGGTALGAAYAIRRGDADALSELGLDLDSLRSLSPVRQCAAILDAVLGEGGHPDDYALKKASIQSLKEVLQSESPPDEIDAVRGFVVNFVYELALVELQAQLEAKSLDSAGSARLERSIRHYLERSVSHAKLSVSGRLKPSDFRAIAARLTKDSIQIIRAVTEAA